MADYNLPNYQGTNVPNAQPNQSYPNFQYRNDNRMTPNYYNTQHYFPQPQGNIYIINTSQEVNNIPISNGLSAAICLAEGTMFLKTIQNGNLTMTGYKLNPLDNQLNNIIPTQITPNNDNNKDDNNNNDNKNLSINASEEKILNTLKIFEENLQSIQKTLNSLKSEKEKGEENRWDLNP